MSMNFVTFNQDYSHLAVGTSRGFRIFTTDPFAKCYETKEGNIAILEMLFSTSLVALILSPRRLQIKNTKRDSIICELTFPTTVLAIRLNRKRLVIVLEDQIYLYDIQTMKLLRAIDTSPNPMAICALSPSSSEDSCFLAYPLPQKSADSAFPVPAHTPPNNSHVPTTSGEILLFDAIKLEAVNAIEAHRSPLSCVQFNNDGKLIATASDKGTIIRVFSVPEGQKLYQFRRGTMPSRIYSIAFNITSTLLCVSSATETIHVFKLGVPQVATYSEPPVSPSKTSLAAHRLSKGSDMLGDDAEDEADGTDPGSLTNRKHNGTFMGLIRRTSQSVGNRMASTMGGYLPKGVAEMWEPARDFAWIRIPRASTGTPSGQMRSVVAMSSNTPQVMVVTNEGQFYVFNVDLAKGGEGILMKQYSVLDINDKMGASSTDF